MPEERQFKTETTRSRSEIAAALRNAAEEIDGGTVILEDATESQEVTLPDNPTFEVELERVTDSETGETYYELEYELSWTD